MPIRRPSPAKRSDRLGGLLASGILSLDHFGQFNKQHGHAVGDTVLRAFGSLLSGRLRASDHVSPAFA